MPQLTQEDFSPVYMDVRKNGEEDTSWPKIVLWALDQPLVYGNMQVMVTVLQRQLVKYGDWTYTASIKPNDHTMATNQENLYGTDPFAEIGTISTSERASFDETIEDLYPELDKLQELL